MANQTIEIDCPPLSARPDTYIGRVLEGTGIEVRERSSSFFGCWSWDYSDIDSEVWEKAKPIIKERITELYNNGSIRYGSW